MSIVDAGRDVQPAPADQPDDASGHHGFQKGAEIPDVARGSHDDPAAEIVRLTRERNGLAARLDIVGSERDHLARTQETLSARLARAEAVAAQVLGTQPIGARSSAGAAAITSGSPFPARADTLVDGDALVDALVRHAQERAEAFRRDGDDLRVENHRLRRAVAQLRGETDALNRLLPTLQARASAGVVDPLGVPFGGDAVTVMERDRLREQAERLRRRLKATYASTSWRLTKPLRALARLLRGQRGPDWDWHPD